MGGLLLMAFGVPLWARVVGLVAAGILAVLSMLLCLEGASLVGRGEGDPAAIASLARRSTGAPVDETLFGIVAHHLQPRPR